MKYLVLLAEAHGAQMQLHHQERERELWRELAIGERGHDTCGCVDALAELGAPGRCAAESDRCDGVGVARAVVDAPGVLDGVALLELPVHVVERLVLEADDFSDFKVGLGGDGLEDEEEVADEAVPGGGEGVLEEVAALLVVLGVEQRALGGEDDGVDDGACGHCGVVDCRGDGVERGDGGGGESGGGIFCGFWLVPFEVEGEAVAAAVVVRSAVVVVRSAVVVPVRSVLLLFLCFKGGTAVQQVDGVQGACVHTGAGAARHARERLALICCFDQVLKRREKKRGKGFFFVEFFEVFFC